MKPLRYGLAGLCVLYAALVVVWSLHWPLVGDSSLMHYVVFLMSKGMRPYADIVDMNLPGTYATETLAMRIFGWGAAGWRAYDVCLVVLLGVAFWMLTRKRDWVAGVIAGAMFAVLHAEDGLAQAGQRDLLIAVLVMWGFVLLRLGGERVKPVRGAFLSQLCLGITVTIKPVLLPLAVVLLVRSAYRAKKAGANVLPVVMGGIAGLLLPVAGMLVWLGMLGALGAFLDTAATLIPLHASLGRRPVAYLLAHSVAPIGVLCCLWLLALPKVLRSECLDSQTWDLLAGAVCALAAYVSQGKGYPYHRYTLLALLLLLANQTFVALLRERGWVRWLGAAALAVECLVTGPIATAHVRTYEAAVPFQEALAPALEKLGPLRDGEVQCLDTFGGCVSTLYNLRLVAATGFLYDCYLYTGRGSSVQDRYRTDFLAALERVKPRLIVVTGQYCFDGADDPHKVGRWPELQDMLREKYAVAAEWQPRVKQRWWSRAEYPHSFVVLERR